jgi:hypothetical protein
MNRDPEQDEQQRLPTMTEVASGALQVWSKPGEEINNPEVTDLNREHVVVESFEDFKDGGPHVSFRGRIIELIEHPQGDYPVRCAIYMYEGWLRAERERPTSFHGTLGYRERYVQLDADGERQYIVHGEAAKETSLHIVRRGDNDPHRPDDTSVEITLILPLTDEDGGLREYVLRAGELFGEQPKLYRRRQLGHTGDVAVQNTIDLPDDPESGILAQLILEGKLDNHFRRTHQEVGLASIEEETVLRIIYGMTHPIVDRL